MTKYLKNFKDAFKLSVVFIIGLSLILSVNALKIDEPQYQPLKIHPGDDVDMWFKITNNEGNDKEVKNIRVSISPHYPFEIKQVNPTKGTATISHLNEGESDVVYFKLHVNDNAPSGNYRLDVTVSYDVVEDEGKDTVVWHRSFTQIFYLPIYGIGSLELTYKNTTLIPARVKNVQVYIKNTGTGRVKQCNMYVLSNGYISPVGETKFYLGSININEIRFVNLKLYANEKTPEGAYQLPIKLTWIGEDGTFHVENGSVGILVNGEPILGISNVITTPKEIKPGDTYVRIDTTITNNGYGRAKNIKLHLITKPPFKDSWSSANIKDIGSLSGTESKTVSFYIDVDKNASSKHYRLPVNIEYMDIFNNKHTITKYLDIYVKPKPIIDIIPKTYNLIPGKDNTVLITVKNNGGEKADSVKITAIRNSAQPFDYPTKSDSIGALKPGENGTGEIVISVDKDALPKEYIITVEIRSTGDSEEGDDNVYITHKTIKVNVVKGAVKTDYTWLIVAIIILLVIVGGYILKKKGGKGDKDNNNQYGNYYNENNGEY